MAKRRTFLPNPRRRRSLMVWERMAVLTANGGKCAYCDRRDGTTVDHLIPFADGGSDDLDNFVPACSPCNNKKRKRDPVVWYLATTMAGEWRGKGTIHGGAGYSDLSLRDLYLERHEEALGWLEHLEEITAEVSNHNRQMWFLKRFFHLGYPQGGIGVDFWLAWSKDNIAEAHKNHFPPTPG
ncbi:HNH endonuclease [Streptomyces sp. NPDC058534]|uniref:HNH endonuclease n=1 Tax=Streptomyces sp. NPDC058534 TaxID=3346541 RepID=UPI0036602AF5